MPSYLVTGANRGIGLGLINKLLETPENFVIAAVRNTECGTLRALQGTYSKDRLAILKVDYSEYSSIEQAAEEAAKILPEGLDYLISNAATSLQVDATFDTIDLQTFEDELRVNTVAPIELIRRFLPLVRKGAAKKVVFISSINGSLDWAADTATLSITYSATKAALNMLARKWGAVLYREGITTVILHPGWVETDMGVTVKEWWGQRNPNVKPISLQDSVQGVLRVIAEAKPEENVPFTSYTGQKLPW